MKLEDLLPTFRIGRYIDVTFFADADLVAETEDGVASSVGVEGEVVESTIRETIPII